MSGPAGQDLPAQGLGWAVQASPTLTREAPLSPEAPYATGKASLNAAALQNLRDSTPSTYPGWLPVPPTGLPGLTTVLCLLLRMVLSIPLKGCAGLWQSPLF